MPRTYQHQLANALAGMSKAELARVLLDIADHMWPRGNPDHEHGPDTTDGIAREFHTRKLSPQKIRDR